MTDYEKLEELIARARQVKMTPEEREAQLRSMAWANAHFENPDITREMVDRAAERAGRRGEGG